MTLSEIRALIQDDINAVDRLILDRLSSDVVLINQIGHYIINSGGKRLRPLLVLLSARACGYKGQDHLIMAAVIEFIHTSTLLHDDVVDEAYERRGFFSIKALWKSKIAVLVGDYLLAQGLLLAVKNKSYQLLEIVSTAVKEMSEGELLQIQKSRSLDITEEVYFDIIRKKTAALIAACTASGAHAAGCKGEEQQKMHNFGEKLGIAFQIKDDLFDYQAKNKVGKPTGNDIREKKMTLPLIYALHKASAPERKKILRTIKKHHKNGKKVREVIAFVKENGGLDYARQTMMRYKEEAVTILQDFKPGPAREALEKFADYVVERQK